MIQEDKPKIYKAGIYIRLSREDGEKVESNSVKNQRDLIHSYLINKKDIVVVCEKVDDGYSGVTFDRPALKELLVEIKNRKINCVIVKDLSRFGRNYIESGRYIEQIFPFLGVRFIAINDNIDTALENCQTDSIIVPFKNLMNDSYSRDISIKARSQREIRQKRGDFVGAFPVYGYLRSKKDKHKLVVDLEPAETVKEIFALRIAGYNNNFISEYLNNLGVPSPLEYKEFLDSKYTTSFKLNPRARWSPMAIDRILKNELYTGVMLQGKESTLNYKIKIRTKKPKESWIRVENTHEAIIPKEDFHLVQKIMINDTRTPPQGEKVYLLSGLLKCGDCGSSMVRKTVKSKGKTYAYYICSKNKENTLECSSHRIRESSVEDALENLLQRHIRIFFQANEDFQCESILWNQKEVGKIEQRLDFVQNELKKYEGMKKSLYEDFKDDILTKADYFEMKASYLKICVELAENLKALQKEKNEILKKNSYKKQYFSQLREKQSFIKLDRAILVLLVQKIIVFNSNRIRIILNYENEFQKAVKGFDIELTENHRGLL